MNLFLAHSFTPLSIPLTDVPSDSILMRNPQRSAVEKLPVRLIENASCLPPTSRNALEVRTAETRGLLASFPPKDVTCEHL